MPKFIANKRLWLIFIHDLCMAAITFPFALYLRLGPQMVDRSWEMGTILFVLASIPAFALTGLYRGDWRFASLEDLLSIIKAVLLALLFFVPLMFILQQLQDLPRSVPFMVGVILIVFLGLPRFLYRVRRDQGWKRVFMRSRAQIGKKPVLLFGANQAASNFIATTHSDHDTPYEVVGIIDEDDKRRGQEIRGIPIMGSYTRLQGFLANMPITPEIFVLCTDAWPQDVARVVAEHAFAHKITLMRLRNPAQVVESDLQEKAQLQPIMIEDLLGRPQVTLNWQAISAMLDNHVVLVTGAGGSIGAELCAQILAHAPKHLIMLDHSEFHLFEVTHKLDTAQHNHSVTPVLGDIRDQSAMDKAIGTYKPDIIFHAAALKHVPITQANPSEAVLTNVVGTQNVMNAAIRQNVQAMVLISTDKAVEPVGVLGITKRIAEIIMQASDHQHKTRFCTVRFGNVLGSTGSVVPLFQDQIVNRQPLSVTDPHVTRFFMTINEAVSLVMQAAALGIADENTRGRILLLKMGHPVKILDLAKQMLRLAGQDDSDADNIVFTGLRPGERLHEQLHFTTERELPEIHPDLMLLESHAPSIDKAMLDRLIAH
ncbi:MAG: nucleoside-diphosphate sugar epimerase/dehydratase, partial [Pseudomonadota bacterium]